jgi:hypothetical protein
MNIICIIPHCELSQQVKFIMLYQIFKFWPEKFLRNLQYIVCISSRTYRYSKTEIVNFK